MTDSGEEFDFNIPGMLTVDWERFYTLLVDRWFRLFKENTGSSELSNAFHQKTCSLLWF